MLRSLAVAALAATLSLATPAGAQTDAAATRPAPDPAELAEARAVIEVMYPPAERAKILDSILINLNDQIRASLPLDQLDDPGLKAIVDELLDGLAARQSPLLHKHTPALLEAIAVAYTNEFTLMELKDVRAFAESSSGGRYLSRASFILGDPAVAEVNTAIMADALAFGSTVRAEFEQKVIAYLNEHPEVAGRLFGAASAAEQVEAKPAE